MVRLLLRLLDRSRNAPAGVVGEQLAANPENHVVDLHHAVGRRLGPDMGDQDLPAWRRGPPLQTIEVGRRFQIDPATHPGGTQIVGALAIHSGGFALGEVRRTLGRHDRQAQQHGQGHQGRSNLIFRFHQYFVLSHVCHTGGWIVYINFSVVWLVLPSSTAVQDDPAKIDPLDAAPVTRQACIPGFHVPEADQGAALTVAGSVGSERRQASAWALSFPAMAGFFSAKSTASLASASRS